MKLDHVYFEHSRTSFEWVHILVYELQEVLSSTALITASCLIRLNFRWSSLINMKTVDNTDYKIKLKIKSFIKKLFSANILVSLHERFLYLCFVFAFLTGMLQVWLCWKNVMPFFILLCISESLTTFFGITFLLLLNN